MNHKLIKKKKPDFDNDDVLRSTYYYTPQKIVLTDILNKHIT